jgi:hypothetical protein
MINCRFHTCLRLGVGVSLCDSMYRISSLKHGSGAACDFRILGMESDLFIYLENSDLLIVGLLGTRLQIIFMIIT